MEDMSEQEALAAGVAHAEERLRVLTLARRVLFASICRDQANLAGLDVDITVMRVLLAVSDDEVVAEIMEG